MRNRVKLLGGGSPKLPELCSYGGGGGGGNRLPPPNFEHCSQRVQWLSPGSIDGATEATRAAHAKLVKTEPEV